MKKIIMLVLSLIMGLSLVFAAGCGSDPAPAASSSGGDAPDIKAVKDRGVLKIGVKVDVPKFGFKDPNTGKVDGTLATGASSNEWVFIFVSSLSIKIPMP